MWILVGFLLMTLIMAVMLDTFMSLGVRSYRNIRTSARRKDLLRLEDQKNLNQLTNELRRIEVEDYRT